MTLIKKIKLKLLFLFKDYTFKEAYISQQIIFKSNHIEDYLYYKTNFKQIFSSEFNSLLLEKSLLQKKYYLAHYILSNENIQYPYPIKKEPNLLESFFTDGLYYKNHLVWLGYITSHSVLHLLKLENNYIPSEHYEITYKLFSHPVFSTLFTSKENQQSLLEIAHPNSVSMLMSIFLNIKLPSSSLENKLNKI